MTLPTQANPPAPSDHPSFPPATAAPLPPWAAPSAHAGSGRLWLFGGLAILVVGSGGLGVGALLSREARLHRLPEFRPEPTGQKYQEARGAFSAPSTQPAAPTPALAPTIDAAAIRQAFDLYNRALTTPMKMRSTIASISSGFCRRWNARASRFPFADASAPTSCAGCAMAWADR